MFSKRLFARQQTWRQAVYIRFCELFGLIASLRPEQNCMYVCTYVFMFVFVRVRLPLALAQVAARTCLAIARSCPAIPVVRRHACSYL